LKTLGKQLRYQTRARRAARLGLFVAMATVLIIGGASARAAVQSAELDALVAKLQQHYQATDSFTADFKETVAAPGAMPRTRSGTVAYRKPGLIRWEFSAPQPETIVSDGSKLYDYDPGLNQVIEMPLRTAFKSRSAVAFILGVGDLQRDFNIRPGQSASDGLEHLTLTPKEGGSELELGIDPHTLDILRLGATDAMGNSTEVQLSRLQRNVAVNSHEFEFVVPPGADIVTPGSQS